MSARFSMYYLCISKPRQTAPVMPKKAETLLAYCLFVSRNILDYCTGLNIFEPTRVFIDKVEMIWNNFKTYLKKLIYLIFIELIAVNFMFSKMADKWSESNIFTSVTQFQRLACIGVLPLKYQVLRLDWWMSFTEPPEQPTDCCSLGHLNCLHLEPFLFDPLKS